MSCSSCHFYRLDLEVGQMMCEAGPDDVCPMTLEMEQDLVRGEVERPCHGCGYDLDGLGPECPRCGVINEWAYSDRRSVE